MHQFKQMESLKAVRYARHLLLLLFVFFALLITASEAPAYIYDPLDFWTWKNPLPQGNNLLSVTYGLVNGTSPTFVAVGEAGTVLYSHDGSTWTESRDVDGTHWSNNNTINGVAFGGENGHQIFVAVGNSGKIMTSSDGILWTPISTTGTNYKAVAYGKAGSTETFVIVGESGKVRRLTYNSTNKIWVKDASDQTHGSSIFRGVAFGHNIFVAVGDSGTIWLSADGSSWTQSQNPDTGSNWTSNYLYAVSYLTDIDRFIAVASGNEVLAGAYSGSAWTWSSIDPSATSDSSFLYGIASGIVPDQNGSYGMSVAVGSSGTIYACSGNSCSAGVWTQRQNNGSNWTTKNLKGIAYGLVNSTSTFVAVAPSGVILTSTDYGSHWSLATSAVSSNDLFGIAYGNNNKYVAVGDAGTILRSSDAGESWTAITPAPTANKLRGVAFSPAHGASPAYFDTFVAVGVSGAVLSSTDYGSSWSVMTNGVPANNLRGIAYGNGAHIAVGECLLKDGNGNCLTGQTPVILKSTDDGQNWSIISSFTLATAVGDGSLTCSGNTVSVYSAAHGLIDAGQIIISGADQAKYNGTFSVTVDDADHFHFSILSNCPAAVIGAGNLTCSGNTATVASTAHGLSSGDTIVVSGADQIEYNGIFSVVVDGPNQFHYTASSDCTADSPATGSAEFVSTATGTVKFKRSVGSPAKSLYSVSYGLVNGTTPTFVAVGNLLATIQTRSDPVVLVSTDNGDSWQVITAYPSNFNDFSSVSFGGGEFVMVPVQGTGNAFYSTDGLTWSGANSQTLGVSFNGVTYGFDSFTGVGSSGNIKSSGVSLTYPAGYIWEPRPASGTIPEFDLYGISYNKYTYVAVGKAGTIIKTDPVAYEVTPAIDATDHYGSVSPSVVTAVATGTGITFTLTPQPNFQIKSVSDTCGSGDTPSIGVLNGTDYIIDSVTHDCGVDVHFAHVSYSLPVAFDGTAGGDVYCTTSASSVSNCSNDPSNPYHLTGSTAYSDILNGTKMSFSFAAKDGYYLQYAVPDYLSFKAVGSSGTALTYSWDATSGLYSWSAETLSNNPDIRGIANGNNIFVAVSKSGKILTYSWDAATGAYSWFQQPLSGSPDMYGVAYGNGKFVAVGASGNIYTSSDGVAWSWQDSKFSVDLKGVAFGGDIPAHKVFVAVGGSGVILTSPDGENWTALSDSMSTTYQAVSYGLYGTTPVFAVVGGVDSNGVTQTLALINNTWTIGTEQYHGSHILNGVAYGGNTFVAVSGGLDSYGKPEGNIWLSSDGGANWTESINDGPWTTSKLNGIAYSNGKFVAVGASGTALMSIDNGATWINTLSYSGQVANGNFHAGMIVTGETSGAYGVILNDADYGTSGMLALSDVHGIFMAGENLEDSDGGLAKVSGQQSSNILGGLTTSDLYGVAPDTTCTLTGSADQYTGGTCEFTAMNGAHGLYVKFSARKYNITTYVDMDNGACDSSGVSCNSPVAYNNTSQCILTKEQGCHLVSVIDEKGPEVPVTSMVFDSGTKTVTALSAGHGLQVNDTITIYGAASGINPESSDYNDYNGFFTVTAVSDANHFSYVITGTPASQPSGTAIVFKRAANVTSQTSDYIYDLLPVHEIHNIVVTYKSDAGQTYALTQIIDGASDVTCIDSGGGTPDNPRVRACSGYVGSGENKQLIGSITCLPYPPTYGADTDCALEPTSGGSLMRLWIKNGQSEEYEIAPIVAGADDGRLYIGDDDGLWHYKFTYVVDSHEIKAAFGFNINAMVLNSDGSIAGRTYSACAGGCPITVGYGGDISIDVTPKDSTYHIKELKVDNQVVTLAAPGICAIGSGYHSATCKFTNVLDGSHSISASFERDKVNVYYSAVPSNGAGGDIQAYKGTTIPVDYDSSPQFKVMPKQGWQISGVTVNGADVTKTQCGYITGEGFICSIPHATSPQGYTMVATFAIVKFKLKTVSGKGGTNVATGNDIDSSGYVQVNYGVDQEFTVTPDDGYHITSVLIDGMSYTSSNPYISNKFSVLAIKTNDRTFEVSFGINTYKITASSGTGGSISPSGNVAVNYKNSQEFTVIPSSGYSIADVKVDGTSQGAINSYKFDSVTDDGHKIEASFLKNVYAITATANTGGKVTCSPASLGFGENSACAVSPGDVYHIVDVKVDGVSKGALNTYKFTSVSGNHTINVTFEINGAAHSLTVSRRGRGSGQITGMDVNWGATNSMTFNYGTSVTITAAADSGNVFDGWDGDCSGASPTCTLTMTQDMNVSALFNVQGEVTLMVTRPGTGSGTIIVKPSITSCGKDCYTYKQTDAKKVTITATPSQDSIFSSWGGNCPSATGKNCVITMLSNKTVSVNFAKKLPVAVPNLSSLSFSNTAVGKKSTKTMKLANNGTGDLRITSITRTGDNAADFSTATGGNIVIKPKKSYSLTVTFQPKAAGSRTASLIIATNDDNNKSIEIKLSGTGTAGKSKLKKAAADMGKPSVSQAEDLITGEELAILVVRSAEGEPSVNSCDGGPFMDISATDPSCRYIKRFYELTGGFQQGGSSVQIHFFPQDPVTKEEIAVSLVRVVDGEPADNYCMNGSPFADVSPEIWSCKYIKRFAELNIDPEYHSPDEIFSAEIWFNPKSFVTREQAATYLIRALPLSFHP